MMKGVVGKQNTNWDAFGHASHAPQLINVMHIHVCVFVVSCLATKVFISKLLAMGWV